MKTMITISVVVPCYNSEQTIERCLRSIFLQSENVNEIIIVDDGSTDHSIDIIKNIVNNADGNIKLHLHEQKNSGPSISRNKGIELSASTHIAFLDSDDEWYIDHIKVVKSFLNKSPDYKIVATKYNNAPSIFSGEIVLKKLLLKNYFFTPCVVLNRKVFLEVKGFNEQMKYAEDFNLWLNIVYKNKGYLLNYIGAGNIINKKTFGERGLSSNLLAMHNGVLNCYQSLYSEKKINLITYMKIKNIEKLKYIRRILLTIISKKKCI